nr:CAZy families GH66 protein [uncultured Bacteroides sp.]
MESSIYLLDPSNADWQAYIGQRNDDVYANFSFDGYQIDQLGNRGDRYDYNGNKVNLLKGYASFINAMKTKHPNKRLVMNAVSQYGASQIAGTGKVDF